MLRLSRRVPTQRYERRRVFGKDLKILFYGEGGLRSLRERGYEEPARASWACFFRKLFMSASKPRLRMTL